MVRRRRCGTSAACSNANGGAPYAEPNRDGSGDNDRRFCPPTTQLDGATFTADFMSAHDLMAAGNIHFGRFRLSYAPGRATLSDCIAGADTERCLWGVEHAGWTAVAAIGASDREWGVFLRAAPGNWLDRQGLGSAAVASINPAHRTAPNTVELATASGELRLRVNGVFVASVPDTQDGRGDGYGFFNAQSFAGPGTLEVTYFAAK